MLKPKRFCFIIFCSVLAALCHAQDIHWMIGTWTGASSGAGNAYKVKSSKKTIVIDRIDGNNFTGTRIKEVDDGNNSKIVIAVSGYLNNDSFSISNGAEIFRRDPPHDQWKDFCTSCIPQSKIIIDKENIVISSRIAGCSNACDGVINYYRLLCDFDSSTRNYLVSMYSAGKDVTAFNACMEKPPALIALEDSIKNAKEIAAKKEMQKLQINNENAAKRQKQLNDSLARVADIQKKKQRAMNDSLATTAKLEKKRQQQIQDSISVARKQRIQDSLTNIANIAKQQKEIQDSLVNIAALQKKKQQQTDDSLATVAKLEKIHQQHIQDSIKNVQDFARKQHIQDSLTNIANIAKRQKGIQDSLINIAALQKKKQQQIDDSLATVAKLEKIHQQHIQDSIKNVQDVARKQHIQDSLTNIANIAKRQKEIQDSLINIAALQKKKQQQIDDSLATVAKLEKIHQQHIQDSIKNVQDFARKQHIQDSLTNIANIAKRQKGIQDSLINIAALQKKKQQQIDDSLATVAKLEKIHQQHIQDSIKNVQDFARKQHIQDSLTNIANIAKRQKEIQDSLAIAAAKKLSPADSVKVAAANKAQNDKSKLIEQRDNVLLQTYHIQNPDILIELFDNAQIDGDKVSVFHNGVLIVNNQMLQREPITFKIHADASAPMHEFILIAENLGTIPPNTALMRVTADKQVYKLSVKTDMKTNAKIIFYYDGN